MYANELDTLNIQVSHALQQHYLWVMTSLTQIEVHCFVTMKSQLC